VCITRYACITVGVTVSYRVTHPTLSHVASLLSVSLACVSAGRSAGPRACYETETHLSLQTASKIIDALQMSEESFTDENQKAYKTALMNNPSFVAFVFSSTGALLEKKCLESTAIVEDIEEELAFITKQGSVVASLFVVYYQQSPAISSEVGSVWWCADIDGAGVWFLFPRLLLREREKASMWYLHESMCVCVCVCAGERKRENVYGREKEIVCTGVCPTLIVPRELKRHRERENCVFVLVRTFSSLAHSRSFPSFSS
jgi:hypothetical protein